MIDSRQKGASYERKIATLLTKELKMKFMRTPGSGAFGTKHNIQSWQGDIILSPDEKKDFPYFIECKKYKEVNLYHYAQKLKSCNVTKWLRKLEEQKTENQYGLLIFCENYGKNMCLVQIDLGEELNPLGMYFFTENNLYRLMLLSNFLKDYNNGII